MSRTIDESAVLQSMPVETRMKHFKGLLEGKSVTGQDGRAIEIPGLDEQYIDQQSAVEGQRSLVEGLKSALAAEKEATKQLGSGDSQIEQDLAQQVRIHIVNLAMMENKLNTLGEQITSIRRRVSELDSAGTK